MRKNHLESVIMHLYRENPTIVSDDNELLAGVFELYGWSQNQSLYYNLKRMPSAESITRCRRKMFMDGKIEYTKEAHATRMKHFNEMRDEYSNYPKKFEDIKALNRDQNEPAPKAIPWMD